ncbi:MAG: helix-turn-helix domain-containing protein [Butyrivibrio sp.]|nr:helix-turn-helix domain-containing protein [Butyrivibrio sp.]
MNFGKKMKELRLQRAVTQEQFAAYLNISPQAVSKWENNVTLPDIQLLPEISVYFGVTIDELFEMTDQKHLQRIENMVDTKSVIDKADFEYAQNFLQNKLAQKECMPQCLTLISALYNSKAAEYHSLAEYYAKEALLVEPENKDNHVNLCEAQRGTYADWYMASHTERIMFYQDFVSKNPQYARGYLWLLDELIADNRCDEAQEVLDKLSTMDSSCRIPLYQGQIAWARGEHERALEIWKKMSEQFADDWLAQLNMADSLAHMCRYDEAVIYYKKGFELQPKPRYTDSWLSMAQIYEIQGKYEEAIQAWENVALICREEWNIKEGEEIDRPAREISRLKELIDKGK